MTANLDRLELAAVNTAAHRFIGNVQHAGNLGDAIRSARYAGFRMKPPQFRDDFGQQGRDSDVTRLGR